MQWENTACIVKKSSYKVEENENRQREEDVQKEKTEGNEGKGTKMCSDSSTK